MMTSGRLSVVFCGYVPVHVLCFPPLYERLITDPAVEAWFSFC